jgi:DNA-binding transcriptional LysR family regulator
LDLRQFRYFASLAREQNYHRAAEVLHIAQPPLSVAIQKLEQELGVRLVERLPRGIRVTPAGEICLKLIQDILERVETLKHTAQDIVGGRHGGLVVGFTGSATHSLIPRIVPVFRRQYPTIGLRLREATTLDIIGALEAGEIDVGILRTPVFTPAPASITPLVAERLVLAVPIGHELESLSRIALSRVKDEGFVTWDPVAAPNFSTLTMVSCEREGFIPKMTEQAAHIHTVIALVESGLGIALVPSTLRDAGDRRVRYLDVTSAGREIHTGLGLAVHGCRANVLAERFVEVATKTVAACNLITERVAARM